MITVVYSTHKDEQYNNKFKQHLLQTVGLKDIQILEYTNFNQYSLTEVYNRGLNESVNDIVVFCHNDIIFEKEYWGKRVLEHFVKKPEYGILGVAGTSYYPSSGRWWDIQGEMIGQVFHQHNGRKWLSEYNKPFGSKIIDSVIVDGVFFAVKKNNLKSNFDESFKGFHFYDTSFCMENHLLGVKVGTISNVSLTHLSIGMTNDEWENNRRLFLEKYNQQLPIKLESKYPINKINPKSPLVSIIIPIYNYGIQFEKTLQSVFDSTYKNVEIVIVDDGSTDTYVKLKLESIKDHPNIKIIHQENQGPSSARNYGVKNSNGVFILPLDGDDTIHPDYIQSCVNILKNNKTISPVYCDTHHIGQIQGVEQRPEWSLERLRQGPFIVNCAMFHRESFDVCDGYDITLKGWEDYDLWIRMGLKGYSGKRIPKPLFTYFHHESDGTVSTEANNNQQELYNKIMNKNFKNENFN
jgi:glycosyltransferase involved in cell wall biosynthesis